MPAPTIGQHTVFSNGFVSTGTTSSIATSAASSDFLVIVFANAAPTSVTDNKGNTYTQQVLSPASTGGFGGIVGNVYAVENGVGGAGHTFTVNLASAGDLLIFVVEVLGALSSGGFDQLVGSGINGSGTSTFSAPTVTTTAINEIVLSFYGSYGSSVVTITNSGVGFTFIDKQLAAAGSDGAGSSAPATTIGPYADTYTQTAADANGYATMTISIKGAVAAANSAAVAWL